MSFSELASVPAVPMWAFLLRRYRERDDGIPAVPVQSVLSASKCGLPAGAAACWKELSQRLAQSAMLLCDRIEMQCLQTNPVQHGKNAALMVRNGMEMLWAARQLSISVRLPFPAEPQMHCVAWNAVPAVRNGMGML